MGASGEVELSFRLKGTDAPDVYVIGQPPELGGWQLRDGAPVGRMVRRSSSRSTSHADGDAAGGGAAHASASAHWVSKVGLRWALDHCALQLDYTFARLRPRVSVADWEVLPEGAGNDGVRAAHRRRAWSAAPLTFTFAARVCVVLLVLQGVRRLMVPCGASSVVLRPAVPTFATVGESRSSTGSVR